MRFVAQINPTKSEIMHFNPNTEVSFLPMEAIGEDGSIDLSRTKTMAEVSSGYTFCRDLDVLVAKITPCFENGKAAQVKNLKSGFAFGSTEFHVLRAKAGLEEGFLLYLVRSAAFRDAGTASMYGAGGQKRVPTNFIADFVVPVPPEGEQKSIVAFLDRETYKIDTLIAKQTEFLIKLDEHRRALITDVVTRGLDSSVLTQETGSRLFPEIPSHWFIKRLKYLAAEVTVGVVVTPSKYYADQGVPALRSLNVKPMKIVKEDFVFFDEQSNRLLSKSMIRAGDVVAVRTGKPGTTAVIPDDLDGANCIDLILIRQSPRLNSRFLAYAMNSDLAHMQYAEGSEGAIQQHFNIETAKNLLLPVPPLIEQEAIVGHLDKRLERLDSTNERSRLMIATLRERRSALITAAVTGQIDISSKPKSTMQHEDRSQRSHAS